MSRAGAIFLTLFALPFLGVGVGMAVHIVRSLQRGGGEDLGFKALFGLIFGGAGLAVLAVARFGQRRLAREHALRLLHPEEPWMWRTEWASGRVPSSAGATVVVAWGFAFFWNLISLPLTGAIPEQVAKGNTGALVGIVFPLAGVGMLIWAIRATVRWRRFGRASFELATLPGVVGDGIRGTAHLGSTLHPPDGFRVRLSCIRRRVTGGRNRSVDEDVVWQEETRIPSVGAIVGPFGTALDLAFSIPASAPPSSPVRSDDVILWRLQIDAVIPGVDYQTLFEVPVFRTAASPPAEGPLHAVDLRARPVTPPGPEVAPIVGGSRITARSLPGGVEIDLPAARNPGFALGMTLFTAAWTGVVVFLLYAGTAALFFAAVFGLVDLLLVWVTLTLWLQATRIRVLPDRLEVRHRMLGFGRTRTHPRDEILGFALEIRSRSGSTPYYDVMMKRRGRRPLPVAQTLRSKELAGTLLAILDPA